MGDDRDGDKGDTVVRFDDYKKRHRQKAKPPDPPGSDFDEATRDLHAAASSTLKLVYLVRDRLGLPQL